MRRTLLLLLSFLACVAWGQTYRYRYWLDNNVGSAVSGSATGEKELTISLSAVGYGLHALHVQGRNSAGVWSSVRTRYFLKEKQEQTCTSARYWIDNDMTTVHDGVATSGVIELDIDGLSNGLHAVHYQKMGADGIPSAVRTRYFLKEKENQTCTSARYWIDNDMTTLHEGVATRGIIDIDITKLSVGLHAVHYQKMGTDGTPSAVRTRYFLVDRVQIGTLSADISIDDGDATNYALSEDFIDIDISDLDEGVHKLNVTLKDMQDNVVGQQTQEFSVSRDIVAMTDNIIYIKPTDATVGTQMSLPIMMKNKAPIHSFRFDLYLPEGVTAVKSSKGRIQGSLSDGRLPEEDEHQLTFSEMEDGGITLQCTSPYDETFTGNDGEIATLKIEIAEDLSEGEYSIVLKNIRLTETDASVNYETSCLETVLNVLTSKNGDVNLDGQVGIGDIVAVTNVMAGSDADEEIRKRADVNSDGDVGIGDIVAVTNIMAGNSAAARRR